MPENTTELLAEAQKLGGKIPLQGRVKFRKQLKDRPGEYIEIEFSFYSREELKDISETAKDLGLMGWPLDDAPNWKNAKQMALDIIPVKDCPVHGPLVKGKDGGYYCRNKVDGKWCTVWKK